ncbi:MAG TPA: magnesium transporter CorA family protein [Candidatus Saccharimonadales bacterium]|nr:magnesium transporter CorA family protein [Candidatus Saccharimonadales bacterium]
MIKYFYKSLRDDAVTEVDAPRRGVWIHAESPNKSEVDELTKRLNIEPGYLEDALDEDEMPRLEREGEQGYIFVRYVYEREDGDKDTAPLLIMFDAELVLTVSLLHLPAVDFLLKSKNSFATTQRTKLILLILTHITDQFDGSISQTSRKIKSIRSRLRTQGITNQDFIDFATIEDELSEFISSLQPTNATLRRLLAGRQLPMFEEDQDIVEDLLLSNEQSVETIRSNLRSIANIREAYSAISANRLNKTLTILTVATILISVPSFAMGIYSLNIPLPFQHTVWIFWVIMAINVTLMSSVIYVARKKRIV